MTIVFRDVPARVCENCGEAFHDEEVVEAIMQKVEQASASGVEIDVRRFALAA
jgi:hypothetical protein